MSVKYWTVINCKMQNHYITRKEALKRKAVQAPADRTNRRNNYDTNVRAKLTDRGKLTFQSLKCVQFFISRGGHSSSNMKIYTKFGFSNFSFFFLSNTPFMSYISRWRSKRCYHFCCLLHGTRFRLWQELSHVGHIVYCRFQKELFYNSSTQVGSWYKSGKFVKFSRKWFYMKIIVYSSCSLQFLKSNKLVSWTILQYLRRVLEIQVHQEVIKSSLENTLREQLIWILGKRQFFKYLAIMYQFYQLQLLNLSVLMIGNFW